MGSTTTKKFPMTCCDTARGNLSPRDSAERTDNLRARFSWRAQIISKPSAHAIHDLEDPTCPGLKESAGILSAFGLQSPGIANKEVEGFRNRPSPSMRHLLRVSSCNRPNVRCDKFAWAAREFAHALRSNRRSGILNRRYARTALQAQDTPEF